MHTTVLEINQNNLIKNISFFKSKIKKETKIMAVVKANAYGSGSVLVSKSINNFVDFFAVAYTNEGVELVSKGISKPVIVLHAQPENYLKIIQNNLQPNIYNLKGLENFIALAEKLQIEKYPIHLKFNTGLNRLGFLKKDIPEILKLINRSSVKIISVFSHLAASEDLNEIVFTKNQISKFNVIKDIFIKELPQKPIFHILNTSGIVNFDEYQMDMVRIGIGMLGFANDKKTTSKLENVLTLKSKISQINYLNIGDSLGYNRAFTANKNTKTATIPIGHADGILRKLGNEKFYVMVNKQRTYISGNICMDMIMLDVTNVDCTEGDEVILFQSQNDIHRICTLLNTIPYEFFTLLSKRIERIIV